MNLIRTEADIEALKLKNNATIIDALNIFNDLCKDIKEHEGTLLHKLPVGDETFVVNRLIWGSNQLRKIAKYNEDAVGYEVHKERLESLEKDTMELEQKLSSVETIINTYEKKKEELETIREKEKTKYAKQQQLEQECTQLEREINSFGENKIPQLTKHKEDVEKQLAETKEKYEQLLKRVNQLQQETNIQNDKVTKLQTEDISLRKQTMQNVSLIEEKEKTIAKCNLEIQNLKQQYQKLNEEYDSAKKTVLEYETVTLPQIQKQLEEVKEQLLKKTTKFYELGCNVKVMTNEVAAVEQRLEKLKTEETELFNQKETLLEQESVYSETIKSYKECIVNTSASIEKHKTDITYYEKEIEIVKTRCEEASKKLQDLLQRYKLLDEKRQCAESEMIQWTAKVMEIQEICNEKENEKNKQEEQYEQLKQKKTKLEEAVKKLGEQQQELINDIRILEETLRKSTVDELREEKEDKEQHLEGLKKERVELNLAIQTLTEKLLDRENEKRNQIDTLNKKKEQLSEREIEISKLRNDKEEWERKLQTLQKEMESLQLWFRSRENSDDKKRMDAYKARIQFLKEAQQEWKEEAQMIQQFANENVCNLFGKFNNDYEIYHQTLIQIDGILNKYQQAYCIVTRALYSEQKGNEVI